MARVRKPPTAKSKIKKINKEIIFSQILSQGDDSLLSDRRQSLPRVRNQNKKTLVKNNQTIFTPNRKTNTPVLVLSDEYENDVSSNQDNEEEEENSSSDESSEEEEPEVDSEGASTRAKIRAAQQQLGPLSTFETKLPRSTLNWKPLPLNMFDELRTLLIFLLPNSFNEMTLIHQNLIQKHLLKPLFKKISHIALPILKPGELDLASQEEQFKYTSDCYDSSVTQLDDIIHQSLIEKRAVETERKYYLEFQNNVKSWKLEKDKAMSNFKFKNKNKGLLLTNVSDSKQKPSNMNEFTIDPQLEIILQKLDSNLNKLTSHTQNGNSLFKTLDRLNKYV